jgi:hypothetical protein
MVNIEFNFDRNKGFYASILISWTILIITALLVTSITLMPLTVSSDVDPNWIVKKATLLTSAIVTFPYILVLFCFLIRNRLIVFSWVPIVFIVISIIGLINYLDSSAGALILETMSLEGNIGLLNYFYIYIILPLILSALPISIPIAYYFNF